MIESPRCVPLLDLAGENGSLREEIRAALDQVIDSQHFILGSAVGELEQAIAAYCGTRYAVGCASGSDALYLTLRAAGIGPGDAVLTSPFSFFATAGCISAAGARPVFADIDPLTFNLHPARVEEALASHPGVRAILPVHLYGGCADMDPILAAAGLHGAIVIEDGAQSIGAAYRGRPALSLAQAGCLSFYPTKNLGAFGDAGMVTTNDPEWAERLKALRVHGSTERYYHRWLGINSRLDTLQAAVLLVKLGQLDNWTVQRQRHADLYREILGGQDLPIVLPVPTAYQTRHVYNQFVIRAARRDALRQWLSRHGVGSEIYYPLPIHLQPCYADLGYPAGAFPESERAAAEVLALPVHAQMHSGDVEYVCSVVRDFYAHQPD